MVLNDLPSKLHGTFANLFLKLKLGLDVLKFFSRNSLTSLLHAHHKLLKSIDRVVEQSYTITSHADNSFVEVSNQFSDSLNQVRMLHFRPLE